MSSYIKPEQARLDSIVSCLLYFEFEQDVRKMGHVVNCMFHYLLLSIYVRH